MSDAMESILPGLSREAGLDAIAVIPRVVLAVGHGRKYNPRDFLPQGNPPAAPAGHGLRAFSFPGGVGMARRKRTIAYVDGFNLYHAIGDLGANHLKWLDLRALAEAFAPRSDHDLVRVVYFTAYAHWRPESSVRHAIYVAALQTKGITAHLGRFKARSRQCRSCGARWTDHEEKESDVNLGITIVRDAMQARYDRALLFTRDSDLVPAVRMARDVSSCADIVIISPDWHRKPSELIATAGGRGHHRFLRRIHLERALLPAEVRCDGGNAHVRRPAAYDPPRTGQ